MPYFDISTKPVEGIPIARIFDSKHCTRIVSIVDKEPGQIMEPEQYLGDLLYFDTTTRRAIKESERDSLLDAISLKTPPGNARLQHIYNNCMSVLGNIVGREFELTGDEFMQPLPNVDPKQVDQLYIAGPSGAGKSTYIAHFLCEYEIMYPKNSIYLFSRKAADECLDDIKKLKRVDIGDELYDLLAEVNPLELFKDTCCIFDDIDTIPDKKLLDFVKKLRDDLLETGRSHGITVISTSHQILNWKHTRNMLNEASAITLFPSRGSTMQIRTLLKNYLSLSPADINRIIKTTGRWVTVYKKSPQYVIYEHGVFFVN